MRPVAHLIPDMVVPLYLHDAASATLDWRARQGYQKAAREGYWVNEKDLPIELEYESVYVGSVSCSTNKNPRVASDPLDPAGGRNVSDSAPQHHPIVGL